MPWLDFTIRPLFGLIKPLRSFAQVALRSPKRLFMIHLFASMTLATFIACIMLMFIIGKLHTQNIYKILTPIVINYACFMMWTCIDLIVQSRCCNKIIQGVRLNDIQNILTFCHVARITAIGGLMVLYGILPDIYDFNPYQNQDFEYFIYGTMSVYLLLVVRMKYTLLANVPNQQPPKVVLQCMLIQIPLIAMCLLGVQLISSLTLAAYEFVIGP